MEGGIKSKCEGSSGGAVENHAEGTFTMSGGTIKDNYNSGGVGSAIFSQGTFILSGDASIPMGDKESNSVSIYGSRYITIDGILTTRDKILLTTDTLYPGRQLLSGESALISTNYDKFQLDSSIIEYDLTESGILNYTGNTKEFYIHKDKGSDRNVGSFDKPFASLTKAVDAIDVDGSVGTIYICSDLKLNQSVRIRVSYIPKEFEDFSYIKKAIDDGCVKEYTLMGDTIGLAINGVILLDNQNLSFMEEAKQWL